MADIQLKNMIKQLQEKKTKTDRPPFAVGPINLSIGDGEFFSILGPSGSGKTTLLRLVAGLIEPSEGKLVVGGVDILGKTAEERNFSMVFQEALLFPHMNVAENVAFGLKMKKVKKRERIKKAMTMLEKVGLKGYENKQPSELSGGQQQRVSLARALVMEPHVLLMDEPFSALDPELREEMRELVKSIQKELDTTLLFVTHDREEAFQLSDRIAIIVDGRVVQVGTPHELYTNPSTIDTAAFLGAKNILQGYWKEGTFMSESGSITFSDKRRGWEADTACHLILRPELFYPEHAGGHPRVIDEEPHRVIRITGTLSKAAFYQGVHHLKLHVGSIELHAKIQLLDDWHIGEGDKVTLCYPLSHVILLQDH